MSRYDRPAYPQVHSLHMPSARHNKNLIVQVTDLDGQLWRSNGEKWGPITEQLEPGSQVVEAVTSVNGGIREFAGARSIIRPVALAQSFRAAKDNNPRVNASLTASVVAFGGTPSAGTVGYATSGIVTTGYLNYDIRTGAGSMSPFSAFGGRPYYSGTPVQGLSYYSASGVRKNTPWMVSVYTNAAEPVLSLMGYSTVYRVNVDGKRCSNVTSSATGGYQDLALNLRGLGSGFHRVDLLLQQDDVIAGIKIPPTAMLLPVERRPVIAMFTDSLGNTSPDVTQVDCLASVVADYLGADIRLFAAGGSGYEITGSSETFIDRIPLAKAALGVTQVDLCVFAGGVNDADSSTYQQTVANTLSAAAAAFSAPVAVFGSWAKNQTADQTTRTALENKISAAATAAGAVFLPVMTDPRGAWITGTGNTAAPAGNGTADLLFGGGDATHWIGAGHSIIGRRAAYAIADAFNL